MAGYDDFSGLLGLMQGQGLGQAEAYPEPVQTAAPRVSMGNILKDNWGLLGTVGVLSALANSGRRRPLGQVIGNAGLDALSALGQVGMAKMQRDRLAQQDALQRSQWEAARADRQLSNAIALGNFDLNRQKFQAEQAWKARELQADSELGAMLYGGRAGGNVQPGLTPLPGSEDDRFEFGRPSGSGAGLGRLAQVPTQTGMGRVMAYHESGTQGSQHVSYGLPETDGVDVGKYSFITKGGSGGSAGDFIRWAGQQDSAVGKQLFNQFRALTGGNWSALDNPALWKSKGAAIWTALAKANPLEFEKLEDGFALGRINSVIKRDLDPGLQAAIKADKTGALYEMALSTINQHGNAATILNRQWKAHGGEGPESFIKAVYWDRGDPYWFRRTKDPSMGRRRMNQEVQDVLGILHSGGAQGQQALPGSPAGAQGNPLAPGQVPAGVPRIGGDTQATLRSPLLQGQQGQGGMPRIGAPAGNPLAPAVLQGGGQAPAQGAQPPASPQGLPASLTMTPMERVEAKLRAQGTSSAEIARRYGAKGQPYLKAMLDQEQANLQHELQVWEKQHKLEAEGRPSFENEQKLRKEYSAESSQYRDLGKTLMDIMSSAKAGNGLNDTALIFNFMRALDPASVVREGEVRMARATSGVPEQIANMVNKMFSGESLTPSQRKDFLKFARTAFSNASGGQKQRDDYYSNIARSYGLSPDRVVFDPYTGLLGSVDEYLASLAGAPAMMPAHGAGIPGKAPAAPQGAVPLPVDGRLQPGQRYTWTPRK